MRANNYSKILKKKLYSGGYTYNDANSFINTNNNYRNALQSIQNTQGNNIIADGLGEFGSSIISKAFPEVGAALIGGKILDKLFIKKDKYGVSDSDTAASISSILNPINNLEAAVNADNLGEGLLSLIPGVGGILGNNKKREQRDNMLAAKKAEEDKIKKSIKLTADKANLELYGDEGLKNSTSYFAMGGQSEPVSGKVKVRGGNIERIAPNILKANGNTHEEGGIELPDAEVENKEILTDDGKVLSDRLGFAKKAEFIARTPEYKEFRKQIDMQEEELLHKMKKEDKKEPNNSFGNNTKTRNMDKFKTELRQLEAKDPINQLFEEQEEMKQNITDADNIAMAMGGQRKMRYLFGGKRKFDGGGFLNTVKKYAPYASYLTDNIANAELYKQIPDIPEPVYYKANDLKTDYNINPELGNLDRSVKSAYKNIEQNSNSSQAIRAGKSAVFADSLDKYSQLYGLKENKETILKNENAMNKQSVFNKNVELRNNIELARVSRANDLLSAQSANFSNLSGDIQSAIKDVNQQDLDLAKLFTISKGYTSTGVNRNLIGTKFFDLMVEDDFENARKLFENNPSDLELFDKYYTKKGKKDKKG